MRSSFGAPLPKQVEVGPVNVAWWMQWLHQGTSPGDPPKGKRTITFKHTLSADILLLPRVVDVLYGFYSTMFDRLKVRERPHTSPLHWKDQAPLFLKIKIRTPNMSHHCIPLPCLPQKTREQQKQQKIMAMSNFQTIICQVPCSISSANTSDPPVKFSAFFASWLRFHPSFMTRFETWDRRVNGYSQCQSFVVEKIKDKVISHSL